MTSRAILINTTSWIGHHGCTLVNRQIDSLCAGAGLQLVKKIPLFTELSALGSDDFELALVNGEGTLHHDQPGARYIAKVAEWAARKRKPAILFNSVFQGNSVEVAEGIKHFKLVFARDGRSCAEFRKFGIAAEVVPDLTLSWEPRLARGQGATIVFTDSTEKAKTSFLRSLARKVGQSAFLPLMARPPILRDCYAQSAGRRLRFEAKRAVSRILPSGVWRDRYGAAVPDFDEFAQLLAKNAGLIVAGRFHAVCLALCLEIPVLALSSNTWKVEALLDEVGLSHRLVTDLGRLEREFLDRPISAFSFSEDELCRIRDFRSNGLQAARRMFDKIARIRSNAR